MLNQFPVMCLFGQIWVGCAHGGSGLSGFAAIYPGGGSAGAAGPPDLECSYATAAPDQMGLSASVWLTALLPVKVYHGCGSVDSAGPSGGLRCGCRPGGKSLKITWTLLDCK